MKSGNMRVATSAWAIATLSFFLPLHETQAVQLSLSNVPLYLSVAADPNIMFTLDDSGSMQFEVIPESDKVYFTFPRPGTLYGASWGYGSSYSYVAKFDLNNKYARYFRTAKFNSLYYDPAKRYVPWSKADGTLMANATATAAYHNPYTPGEGTRDLTTDNTQTAYWVADDGTPASTELTFYPATYFTTTLSSLTGPADGNNSSSNFTKVEIKSTTASYPKTAGRTDCAGATCTYAEEMQNFANWYSYYRSRILMSRAGVGKAFAAQGNAMRVGFAAINNSPTVVSGVKQFTGTDRTTFFSNLYGHVMPSLGTPLRRAMDDVGKYFSRTDDAGPWGPAPQLSCRQNYHVLMTDGYWNGAAASTGAARENVDNATGPSITGSGSAFQYTPVAPYKDDWSNTLADVAMYYWNRDLRTDLTNNVPSNTADPAYWQHMVNFTVGLGVTGTLDPNTASPEWPDPNPTAATGAKVDDLWHAALNSRGAFFSAADPATFASGLNLVLNNITSRNSSAAAITTNASRLDTDTQVYQARFNSTDWSGQLIAYSLNADGTLGAQQWDASTLLPAPADRKIFTHTGTSGLAFYNFSSLSSSQQTALNKNIDGVDDGLGATRVSWLRGDRTTEIAQGGQLRNRGISVLGDIANSDLLFVKSLNFGYETLPSTTPGQSSYQAYVQSTTARTPVIYAGGNDGMLHAFNATSGVEMFGYVPNAVYPNLSALTSPAYTHRYYVDGNAYAGDAYFESSSSWKTVLLGTLGGGGKSIFALDITDPTTFAASNVLWEFTDAGDLGYVQGQAKIALLNNGVWAAIISNGYNSTNEQAYLYIVNLQTGSLIKKIPTNNSTSNGLSSPALIDTNGDKIVDIVYAGDLQGNIWKFNLSSANEAQWKVAYTAGGTNLPLFTARNASTQVQPITSPLEVGMHPDGGYMVYFGTGQFIASGDNTNINTQTLYGIWDNGSAVSTTDRTALQQQTILTETGSPVANRRTVSANSVVWTGPDAKRGWYLDLLQPPSSTQQGERSVVAPLLSYGRIIFTTLIPSSDACTSGGRNWVMLLDAQTGGMFGSPQFDTNGDNVIDTHDELSAGVGSDGIRSESTPVGGGSVTHLIAGKSDGTSEDTKILPPPTNPRSSWIQLQ